MIENNKKPKSIFEAASKLEKARLQKKTGPSRPTDTEQVTIISDIFLRVQKIHEELANQVDALFSRSKIAPSAYRSYLSRPQNFSDRDWKLLLEQKKKNEELLKELARKVGAKEPPSPKAIEPTQEKKEEPTEKELTEEPPSEEEIPKKPTTKKPKIVTRRHWIGM